MAKRLPPRPPMVVLAVPVITVVALAVGHLTQRLQGQLSLVMVGLSTHPPLVNLAGFLAHHFSLVTIIQRRLAEELALARTVVAAAAHLDP